MESQSYSISGETRLVAFHITVHLEDLFELVLVNPDAIIRNLGNYFVGIQPASVDMDLDFVLVAELDGILEKNVKDYSEAEDFDGLVTRYVFFNIHLEGHLVGVGLGLDQLEHIFHLLLDDDFFVRGSQSLRFDVKQVDLTFDLEEHLLRRDVGHFDNVSDLFECYFREVAVDGQQVIKHFNRDL